MSTGIPNVIEDAIGTVHNAISGLIGTSPQVETTPAGTLRIITASQAATIGLTPAQLTALGYVIVAG